MPALYQGPTLAFAFPTGTSRAAQTPPEIVRQFSGWADVWPPALRALTNYQVAHAMVPSYTATAHVVVTGEAKQEKTVKAGQ